MSKPKWIRFLGWLSLFLLLTPLGWPIAERLTGHALPSTVIPGLMWALCFPCSIIWFLASAVHLIIRTSAKAKAEALAKFGPEVLKPHLAGQNPVTHNVGAPEHRWGDPHYTTPPNEVKR